MSGSGTGTPVTPTTDYCTAAQVKAHMPDMTWGASYDGLLASLVSRASRLIDRHCNREDGWFKALTTATARVYDGYNAPYMWIDECTEVSSVEVKDASTDTTYTVWTTDDYILARGSPSAPVYGKTPYTVIFVNRDLGDYSVFTSGRQTVKVTAKWGYATTTPIDITQAAIIQTVRWFKRGQQAFQDTGAIMELGQLRYLEELDPDVRLLLSGYQRSCYG